MTRLLPILFVALLVAPFSIDEPALAAALKKGTVASQKNLLAKLKLGMSYEEVKKIMGSDGEQTHEYELGGQIITTYDWVIPGLHGPRATYTLVFNDNKLSNKSLLGSP